MTIKTIQSYISKLENEDGKIRTSPTLTKKNAKTTYLKKMSNRREHESVV